MRKTNKITGLLYVIMLFSSCGYYAHKQKQVLVEQIRNTNDSLDKMTKEWHNLLDKAVKVKNFSALNAQRIQIGQFLSRRRSVIANLELPADAETLRGSEDVYLSAQVGMVTDFYPQFELFNDLTPDSTIQYHLRLVSKDVETEVSWYLTIKKSLDVFVIKNGIKNTK